MATFFQDHCCSTPTGGVAVVVACSRDMFYNFNKTAIIQKFKNRYGSKYPYYSSPNMKMPFKGTLLTCVVYCLIVISAVRL